MDFLEALRCLGAPVRMRGGVGVLYLVGQALRGRLGSSIAGRREAVGIAAILVAMVLLAAMRAAGRIGLDRGLGAHFRAIRLWGRSVVRAAEVRGCLVRGVGAAREIAAVAGVVEPLNAVAIAAEQGDLVIADLDALHVRHRDSSRNIAADGIFVVVLMGRQMLALNGVLHQLVEIRVDWSALMVFVRDGGRRSRSSRPRDDATARIHFRSLARSVFVQGRGGAVAVVVDGR